MGATARTLLRICMIGNWNRACARALLVGSIAAAGNAAAGVDEPVVDLLFSFIVSDPASSRDSRAERRSGSRKEGGEKRKNVPGYDSARSIPPGMTSAPPWDMDCSHF